MNFDKFSLKEKVAKVALAILILTPGIGLLALAPGALLDVVNFVTVKEKSPNKSQEEDNSFKKFDSEEDGVDYEICKKRNSPWINGRFSSAINNRTVMKGASRNWDKERIKEGKLAGFKSIGAESVILNTEHGDRLHGCYFGVEKFDQEIKNMGGEIVECSFDHEFFKDAQPIQVTDKKGIIIEKGVRISKKAALDEEFRAFCEDMGYTILLKDSSYILLSSRYTLSKETCLKNYEIEMTDDLSLDFQIFKSASHPERAIYFEDSKKSNEHCILKEFNLYQVAHEKGSLMCDFKLVFTMIRIKKKCKKNYSFLNLKKYVADRNSLKKEAVVLTTHQTGTFFTTSREIMTFLCLGINVFAYDNAGKGLSEGMNAQKNMSDAVTNAGNFLINEKRFEERCLIFKGQCAGGLPTSEAAKKFPKATVWVDQAPNNYSDVAKRTLAHIFYTTEQNVFVKLLSRILPDYDVVANLKHGSGNHIYTIGTEDRLVPKKHQNKFKQELSDAKNGYYYEMPGATHVSDWWQYPIAKDIEQIFRETALKS